VKANTTMFRNRRLYMVGTIDEALAKAEKMKASA